MNKNKRKSSCIAFLDFQKAFDTVDHKLLLRKLEAYGVRGNVLTLFQSYLSNRKQFVQIGPHKSTYRSCTCGVPQGSVLGPLLFLIYINDLPQVCTQTDACLFADDTSIHAETTIALQNDLNNVSVWLRQNKMSLNVDKSQLLFFGKCPSSTDIEINNKKISVCHEAKYLGVYLDDKLTFEHHISMVTKRVSQLNGFIYRGRSVLSTQNLIFYYNAYVKPIIQYGILAYGCTLKSKLDSILLVQKRILRTIYRKKSYESVSGLFEQNRVLTVHEIFVYELFKYLVKLIKSSTSNWLNEAISGLDEKRCTRSRTKGIIGRQKLVSTKFKSSLQSRTTVLYNALTKNEYLPKNIKSLKCTECTELCHGFRDTYLTGNFELVNIIFS